MNKVKDSLQENLTEILANLPPELHEGFKKEIEGMTPVAEAPLTGDSQVSAIKAELVANPAVDESAAAAELKEIKPCETVVPESEDEMKAHQAELLKKLQS